MLQRARCICRPLPSILYATAKSSYASHNRAKIHGNLPSQQHTKKHTTKRKGGRILDEEDELYGFEHVDPKLFDENSRVDPISEFEIDKFAESATISFSFQQQQQQHQKQKQQYLFGSLENEMRYLLKTFFSMMASKRCCDEAAEHGISTKQWADVKDQFPRALADYAFKQSRGAANYDEVPIITEKLRHELLDARYRDEKSFTGEQNEQHSIMLKMVIDFVYTRSGANSTLNTLRDLTDLRDPHDWYPGARSIKRKIVFHTGPTNSGKSYKALQRLANAASGIYCSPLRLLAVEAYQKLNKNGVMCSLVTGDDQRNVDNSTHIACTVEMANCNLAVDCVVIDEIQMIGEQERGWAWTRALLGIRAPEIHVCGEPRAVNLVKKLCEDLGETVEISEYKRLGKLNVEQSSLRQSFDNLKRGDCLVAFSRNSILQLKREIEKHTPHKCAVVYGSLPSEARIKQCEEFNKPNGQYSVLIATDAIAFGLNLNIRRVIFYKMTKFDGESEVLITPSHVRQIAGRAGRFGSVYPNGLVTCFREDDMNYLRAAMRQDLDDIKTAGLLPTLDQFEALAAQFPDLSLSKLMDKFSDYSRVGGSFFVCDFKDRQQIAELIEDVPLSFNERYTFSLAPLDVDDPLAASIFVQFVKCHEKGKRVKLSMDSIVNAKPTHTQLAHMETVYKILDVYCWLSYRFPNTFTEVQVARELQAALLKIMTESLYAMTPKKKKSMRSIASHKKRPRLPR